MNVLGSKGRKGGRIAALLNNVLSVYPSAAYIEPFVGAAQVLYRVGVNPSRLRFASDLNEDLINLYCALKDGWDPPSDVSRDEWADAKLAYRSGERSPYLTFVGYAASYASYFYAAYARNSRDHSKPNTVVRNARNSLLKRWKEGHLADVPFSYADYRGIFIPTGSVVYADPPYESTSAQRPGDVRLDYRAFWKWAEALVTDRDCKVYVSGYAAPDNWKPVLDISAQVNFADNAPGRWQPEYVYRLRRAGEATGD